jgi:hypothetical protein
MERLYFRRMGQRVGRIEGEGEIAVRLHERIHAMRQRRRRLSLRERLRRYRRMVDLGLKGKTEAKPVGKPGRRLRAQELATKAIEKIIDPSAPPEEQAQRRRRLTKGPTEFREDRIDLPKVKK